MVDEGVFEGLTRNGYSITKTYDGDETQILKKVKNPPFENELGESMIRTINEDRTIGEEVTEENYLLLIDETKMEEMDDFSYPAIAVKLNPWEGSCKMEIEDGIIYLETNSVDWWGCGLELQSDGKGENLSAFSQGQLHFEMKGESEAIFQLGFQSGIWGRGDQVPGSYLHPKHVPLLPCVHPPVKSVQDPR